MSPDVLTSTRMPIKGDAALEIEQRVDGWAVYLSDDVVPDDFLLLGTGRTQLEAMARAYDVLEQGRKKLIAALDAL